MKIGLDIMGGDFAPQATILGAIAAHKALSASQQLVLIGDKDVAVQLLHENNFDPGHFEFHHTTEVIGMAEHPAKAVINKPGSSISVGFKMLKEGAIHAFSSAGNSGAMLVGAMFSVKTRGRVCTDGQFPAKRSKIDPQIRDFWNKKLSWREPPKKEFVAPQRL